MTSTSVTSLIALTTVLIMSASFVNSFQPFSVEAPSGVFTNQTHPQPPSTTYFASSLLASAVPTNAWWLNAVLSDGTQPIFPLPLQITMSSSSVAVGYPSKQDNTNYVATWWVPGMAFASSASLSTYQVVAFDSLSVTMQFAASSGSLRVPLTRGSPYVTAIYTGIAPSITTINAITSVNGGTTWGSVSGSKFKITMNNGQTFILYSDHSDTFTWGMNSISSTSTVSSGWVLRLAALTSFGGNITANEATLDAYSGAYATGGSVTYVNDYNNNLLNTTFNWKSAGNGQLLTFALPHQQSMLTTLNNTLSIQYDSVKGAMTPVIGSTWTMSTPMLPSSFTAPRSIAPRSLLAVQQALLADSSMTVPTGLDPYTFGKIAAKLARLVLIADEIGQTDIARNLRQELSSALIPWLTGTNSDPLIYDLSWRGIVSTAGIENSGADYGQGYYNDHHFHYGYITYSIAVLLKDPAYNWFLQTYRTAILCIARDIANPSSADPYFPVMRHVDAYEGHSWAAGIFPFGDGRDSESSSEAINAYYAIMLLGKSLGDPNMEATGRTLYTLEVHGVNTYWHMTNASTVYPPLFSANKCVGIVWGDKVVQGTWFASGSLYVHGIQMLPFTPATEFYLTQSWIAEEYPYLLSTYQQSSPAPTDPWMGFVYGAEAVLDPCSAWSNVGNLGSYDNGNTLTNMLYWIGTRPNMPDITGQPGTGAQTQPY